MAIVSKCPSCNSGNWVDYLTCKDFTVSHETFSLKKCKSCNLIVTSPRPEDDRLSEYYQSDEYISHSSKASTLIDRIYLIARSYTLKWKLGIIDKYKLPKKTILDFGCGTGDFLKTCRDAGWTVEGIEPSPIAREKAIEKTGAPILNGFSIDHSKRFGTITLWHVLEHVPDPNSLISNLSLSLEDDGTVFIAVPNHESFDALYYKEYWAGYDVPRHLWHFSKENMNKLLSNNRLQIKEIIPMKLDAYYVSMLSEKYKNNSKTNLISLLRAIFKGLRSNHKGNKTGEYSSLIYVAKK